MINNYIIIILLLIIGVTLSNTIYEHYYPDVIVVCEDKNQSKPDKQLPSPSPCMIEDNTDYFGNTYKTLEANNPNQCCKHCVDDIKNCKAWTYDKKDKICRLKYQKNNITKCQYRISGIPNNQYNKDSAIETTQNEKQKSKYVRNEWDCDGNDIFGNKPDGSHGIIEINTSMNGVDKNNILDKCQELCDKYPNCAGFSFNGTRCPLKHKKPHCPNSRSIGYNWYEKQNSI